MLWDLTYLFSLYLPTILEAYAKKYKFKQQRHTNVMKMTNFDYIAKSAVPCTAGIAYSIIAHR